MKLLLAALLLFAFSAHAQTSWPRNPKTGKIEFTGALPWPANAKTEAQRRALVRRWYLAKLTDESAEEIQKETRTIASPTLLTYAGLPSDIILQYGHGPNAILLGYQVALSPNSKGLSCNLSTFTWNKSKGVEATNTAAPLEQIVEINPVDEGAGLAALRKRLAMAVAGW